MTWQTVAQWSYEHVAAICVTFGLGGGVGIVKFLRHMPAPFQADAWRGSVFDWLQDLASNNSRIGERRTRDGIVIPPVPAPKEVPAPVPAAKLPEPESAPDHVA